MDFPCGSVVKNLPPNVRDMGSSLAWEDTLEEEMATHFSILAWKVPRTEKLVSYSPCGCKELDMTNNAHMQ